jgi:hypothetical protein
MAMQSRAGKPKWEKEDFFPIITRIIEHEHQMIPRFIRRDEIVAQLLKDSEARKLVNVQELELWAGNMIDWFSAHFTLYKNGDKRFVRWGSFFDRFERTEIQGHPAYKPIRTDAIHIFPDEVDDKLVFREGAMKQVLVNAYERDPNARKQCIAKYGCECFICKFSFGASYGKVADGLIHVHHLRQLSMIRKEYAVDPTRDLRPVCPNCHAVLHLRNPAYSIEEVVVFLSGS